MTGTDGTYTVNDAVVCWSPSVIDTSINGRLVDAVIGTNLFSQVKVLLDGPNRKLGILVP
jgi:hypothetical protein